MINIGDKSAITSFVCDKSAITSLPHGSGP